MSWRGYQRIFELMAVLAMITGVFLMWLHRDAQHYVVYMGFALLAAAKMIESVNLDDPSYRIIRIAACLTIFVLVGYNLLYHVRSMVYILIPLAVYYLVHYRWTGEQKRL